MSAFSRIVSARDILQWALDQGVFTRVAAHTDGPWAEVGSALIVIAGEGLNSPSVRMRPEHGLDFFEDFLESTCLDNLITEFGLSAEQTPVVMQIATEIRLFFDASTIFIDDCGLDGPLHGDLNYQCTADYQIEVPRWAAMSVAPNW